MSLNNMPQMDTVHIDDNGDIQFFTASGQEGIITEKGATLYKVGTSALATELELPVDDYVEPAERP